MPANSYPRDNFIADMLLEPDAVYYENSVPYAWFCSECMHYVNRQQRPLSALANGMWIGKQPDELLRLSMPEQLLIAKAFPRCYVYKLFPRGGYQGQRADELQRGMRGNVTAYNMDINGIANMIDGSIMPNPLSVLPSLIGVCIIGQGQLPSSWKKQTFADRREAIRCALQWLKANNPLYFDINISSERLETLPADGVPLEIEAVI